MSKKRFVYTLSMVDPLSQADGNQPANMNARIIYLEENRDTQKQTRFKQYRGFLGIYLNLWMGFQYCVEGMSRDAILNSSFNFVYLPRETEVVCFLKKGNYKTMAFHFSLDFLSIWKDEFPLLNNFLKKAETNKPAFLFPYHLSVTNEILVEILYILNDRNPKSTKDVYLRGKIYEVLKFCLKEAKLAVDSTPPKKEPVKIIQVHDYILQHLHHPCNVQLLAAMVDMDKRKLTTGFKRMYKMNIINFWMGARLNKGKLLLKNTAMTIKEIALSLGYKTASNFTDVFKKKFGLPPIAIRNLYHDQKNPKPKKRRK